MKEKILNLIGEQGWDIDEMEDDNHKYSYELSKFSPKGQDFNFYVNIDNLNDFASELLNVHDNFDVSYETSLWLGGDGHGKNGAPHDMKDVYEDMEACKSMIHGLYVEVSSVF